MPDSFFGSIEPAPSVVIAWPSDLRVLSPLVWRLLWTPGGAWEAVHTPAFEMARRVPITPPGRPGPPSSEGLDLWWPGTRCSDGVADAVASETPQVSDSSDGSNPKRLKWSLSAEVTSMRLKWSLSAEVTSDGSDQQAIGGGDIDAIQVEPLRRRRTLPVAVGVGQSSFQRRCGATITSGCGTHSAEGQWDGSSRGQAGVRG